MLGSTCFMSSSLMAPIAFPSGRISPMGLRFSGQLLGLLGLGSSALASVHPIGKWLLAMYVERYGEMTVAQHFQADAGAELGGTALPIFSL